LVLSSTNLENDELLYCYYSVDPETRGYRARPFDLWHEQKPGREEFTEQRLAGQVSSVLRRKVFFQLELEKIKSRTRSVTCEAATDSPRLNVLIKSLDSLPECAVIIDPELGIELPVVEDLVTLREEILCKFTALHNMPKLHLLSLETVPLQTVPSSKFKEKLSDVIKVLHIPFLLMT